MPHTRRAPRLHLLRREQEIVRVLFRHGLGWIVTSIGLGAAFPFHWGLLGHPKRSERYSAPEHLRMAFEDLGPTFIKLAQILSTRPDLISPEYARELSKLQDDVPAMPFAEIEHVLREELGDNFHQHFEEFETATLGSASIAQVYRAKLKNGSPVVVKVQRPGVTKAIALDLEILDRFARRMDQRAERGRHHDVVGFVAEFAFSLTNELDYKVEGDNADRIRRIHGDDPRIFIPKIHWDYSTSRVLVMDEVRGTKVKHADALKTLPQADRRRLAEAATEITMKQIFEAGFFHADPHPGNFVIMEDSRIGLMDFGLVGTLSEAYRESFLRFTYQMVQRDTEAMLDCLWELGITQEHAERPAIQRDMNHVLYRFKESSLGELAAGDMLGELMNVAYRHQLPFPANLSLLFKVLSMNEGVAATLDPDFQFFVFIEPRLHELWKQYYSPAHFARKLEKDTLNLFQLMQGLPHRTSRLIQRLETGDLQFTVRDPGTEREYQRIATAIERLTATMTLILLAIAVGFYIIAADAAAPGTTAPKLMLGLIGLAGINTIAIFIAIWRLPRP